MKIKPRNSKSRKKSGELIILADWKAPKEVKKRNPPPYPKGRIEGDKFSYHRYTSHHFTSLGARRGDEIMVYITDDVKPNDFIGFYEDESFYVEKLLSTDEAYLYLEGSYGEEKTARAACLITGRVVGVWRVDHWIETPEPLRAIHPVATLYQFRRRA